MPDAQSFPAKMQKSYGVELPARYRKFLDKKEYTTLGNLKLADGYLRGTFEVASGTGARCLVRFEDLGADH